MTWTKLGDDFADRLEDLELTPTACWLHVAALIYCNRAGNNGRLPASKLGKVAAIEAPDLYIAELEQQGLWVAVDGGRAWQVEWRDQELAEDVLRRREGDAERQRKRRQHLAGDHSLCSPGRDCGGVVTRDVRRESRRESRPPVPPVPSRPTPKGVGRGQRCEHGQPIAVDGERCPRCAETPTVAPPAVDHRAAVEAS